MGDEDFKPEVAKGKLPELSGANPSKGKKRAMPASSAKTAETKTVWKYFTESKLKLARVNIVANLMS